MKEVSLCELPAKSKICHLVTPESRSAEEDRQSKIHNSKSIIPHPANLVNPVIDSLPLTLRAAFSSLSPLRSDSVKKCFLNRKSNAQ
ncbi:MAG: hypothetical protein EBY32_09640 [Proteobacteria bacterium]|nr:hypothetical protein [Pseudomonadota bacterium]